MRRNLPLRKLPHRLPQRLLLIRKLKIHGNLPNKFVPQPKSTTTSTSHPNQPPSQPIHRITTPTPPVAPASSRQAYPPNPNPTNTPQKSTLCPQNAHQ